MQCVFYMKNGMVLKSTGDIDRTFFNNPDIVRAEFAHLGNKINFDLVNGRRLIFFKQVEMNSPVQTTYCIGYQMTVKGRNQKYICKINPNGVIELGG